MFRRVLVTFVLAQSVASAVAWACTCDQPDPSAATAIFVGVARGTSPRGCSGGGFRADHVTVFDVDAPCRGDLGATVQVVHRLDGDSCGFEFAPGERFVVFAEEDEDGNLLTTLCSGNEPTDREECPSGL